MNFITQIERFQTLNKLITQRKTGTPCELAERLGVGRTKLYELLDDLKSLGKETQYDRRNRTFYYLDDSKLDITFSVKVICPYETKKIYGGNKVISSVLFSERSEFKFELLLA